MPRRQRYAKWGLMPTDQLQPQQPVPPADPSAAGDNRPLTEVAKRALAEAAARRAERERNALTPSRETNGRGGPDPTRYGDWEVNGLASDF
ncbi:MAG: succinate dehydrogenase assembly factor 4 [Xanthobacteraceae bacterium]